MTWEFPANGLRIGKESKHDESYFVDGGRVAQKRPTNTGARIYQGTNIDSGLFSNAQIASSAFTLHFDFSR